MARSAFVINNRYRNSERLPGRPVQERGYLPIPQPRRRVRFSDNSRISRKVLPPEHSLSSIPKASEGGMDVGRLEDLENIPKLSRREGGLANVKSYCRFYLKRPMNICNMCICSGAGIEPPCVDLFWCLNKPFKSKDPISFDEGEEE